MNTKDEATILSFRKEYEESGLSADKFAQEKGMSYWETSYVLRKALHIRKSEKDKPITFKEVKIKSEPTAQKEVRIKTSYGAEIIIPI